ncbi:carbohydrate ABC transporter permease [Nonomuraea angiospora]|uniref:carbohydrate ABC transporter permease n=1 Tax=Nonomuraea angiospora TaxID=46172 RepID=UPI00344CC13E
MTRPVWMEPPRPSTKAAKAVAVMITVALVVIPFWVVVATSLSPDMQVIRNGGWSIWPERVTLDAYRRLFGSGVISHAVLVSAVVTLVGTAVSLTATVLMAYALARPSVFGGKPIMLGVLLTFLFPPAIIPSFLVVSNLDLRNHYAALIAPVLISSFNLVIMRGYFQGLPAQLSESARIDGAGDGRVLWHVVLPLSRAIIAVVGFYYAVGYWNSFFNAMLYLDDQSTWPLQPMLRQIVMLGANPDTSIAAGAGASVAPQTTTMATVVVAVLPILAVYPLVQRFFTKGVLTGAIKG